MLTQFKTIQDKYMLIISFHQSVKNIVLLKAKTFFLLNLLLKYVWLLSAKFNGHQSFNFFPVTFQLRYQLSVISEQANACQSKILSHRLPKYSSFHGWRFFQTRVSARKPLCQLGLTPTKVRDFWVVSRGECPGVSLPPLPEHQCLPLVDNQLGQNSRYFLGSSQLCK